LLQMIRRSNIPAGLKAADREPLAMSNSDSANALRDRRLDHRLTQIRRVCIRTCTRGCRQERRSLQASAVSNPDRTPTLTGVRYRHSLDANAGHRFLSLVDHHLTTSSLSIIKVIASLLCDLIENENDVSLTSLSINRLRVTSWHLLELAHCPLHVGTG
jgi:hypothetical protein